MQLSLSRLSFYNTLFSLLLFSLVLGYFIYTFSDNLYNQKVIKLEKSFYEHNKALIVQEVERALKGIESLKATIYDGSKSVLIEKVNIVKKLIDNDKSEDNISQLIHRYEAVLDSMKWDNNTGYFYIFDSAGKLLYHGANKTIINQNILTLAKDSPQILAFFKDSLTRKQNYGTYEWYKPNGNKKMLFEKYVYIKKDDKYNIYIAAGIYKDEIDKKILTIIRQNIYENRFGQNSYGYFWINDLEGMIRVHPLNPELENRVLGDEKTKDQKAIIDTINKKAKEGGGFVHYEWYRPDTLQKDEKISYVKPITGWSLVLGSGFYLSELQEILQSEKEDLKTSTNEYVMKMLAIMLIMIFIALMITHIIALKINKVERERIDQMNMLEQYKLILDKSSVVSKTNLKGIITYVNDRFEQITGYAKASVIGKAHNIVRHPDTPKVQFEKLWRTIKQGEIWNGVIKNKKQNGESYFNNTTIVPIKDAQGEIVEYISSGNDVSELIENRSKLQSLFKTDALTGLGSRVSLIDTLSDNNQLTLALLNIDRFKEVNDSYSYEIGDKVIKGLADRLFEFFSQKRYALYRVQADIFALLSESCQKEQMVSDIKAFMDTLGKEPFVIQKSKLILSYTCGIASNTQNLFTFADIALSEAKNKKVKIKEYDASMNSIELFRNNILWVERLHRAIQENRVIPHFQPIYNYHTQKIEKYEALMRLVEDDHVIYPSEYLDIAKKTKLYPELTYKMIEKVISQFAQNDLEFSINLCVEDLMNEELMIFLFDYADTKDVFNRMVLEIVESEEIEDSDYIAKLIKKFKQKGARIAIDDFGSGYSNYEYLISLHADYLKIDGSIIKRLLSDTRTLELVKSMVKFAKKSNIKVIAEFVSDAQIDAILRDIGVDYAQGYYYGKPSSELL